MRLGEFEINTVSDGRFKLDGGAMFGIVPKVIWDKLNKSDRANRITLGLNAMLIRGNGKNILVDTGIGDKFQPKYVDIYSIKKKSNIPEKLGKFGLKREDIDVVILSHLHFDHCGGNTMLDSTGKAVPTYPNAEYYVQRGEFEVALSAGERTRASYLPENYMPLKESGQLKLVDGDVEILPGISVKITGGHAQYHQVIFVESGGKKAVFWADLIPTCSHIKTPFIMGYDLYPLSTAEMKKKLVPKAIEEEWLCVFEHDPRLAMGYIRKEGDKITTELVEKSTP